jgi:putative acetyltransferase
MPRRRYGQGSTEEEMTIREDRESDIPAIEGVERAAFGQENEAHLVDALRRNQKLIISLVAEIGGEIVGHIAFSEMRLEPSPSDHLVLGVAPVAVQPGHQRKGIGSSLIIRGLKMAHEKGYTHAVLLGEPQYYRRFGFIPAVSFGIKNEYTSGDEFMIKALDDSAMPREVVMKYQPEFSCM